MINNETAYCLQLHSTALIWFKCCKSRIWKCKHMYKLEKQAHNYSLQNHAVYSSPRCVTKANGKCNSALTSPINQWRTSYFWTSIHRENWFSASCSAVLHRKESSLRHGNWTNRKWLNRVSKFPSSCIAVATGFSRHTPCLMTACFVQLPWG